MPAEAEPILGALENPQKNETGRRSAVAGLLNGAPVLVLAAGMGKVNAAQGLTALLEHQRVRGVIGFGIAGAYVGSGLGLGDVALASSATYGDEGSQTPAGWISTKEIGIPLLQTGAVQRFNEFPLEPRLMASAARALETAGLSARTGMFLTVSCCAGTTALGEERARRFGAICEDMETAALAHVAELYEIPLLAVRGISNLVENRDPTRWRIHEAAQAACRAVHILATHWNE